MWKIYKVTPEARASPLPLSAKVQMNSITEGRVWVSSSPLNVSTTQTCIYWKNVPSVGASISQNFGATSQKQKKKSSAFYPLPNNGPLYNMQKWILHFNHLPEMNCCAISKTDFCISSSYSLLHQIFPKHK